MAVTPKSECDKRLELELGKAEGASLHLEQEQWLSDHCVVCEACEIERDVLSVLADDTGPGAARELDELSRRRLVEDIVARADALIFDDELDSEEPPKAGRFSMATRFAAIGAAAAVVLLTFGVWKFQRAPSLQLQAPPAQMAHSVPPAQDISGGFALISGDVSVEGIAASFDGRLELGQLLETGQGRAVVALPTGIQLSLGPETKASLDRPDEDHLEIILTRGDLLASVDPARQGPLLSVVTPSGRVRVTGTVFSVTSREERMDVRVLRGKVEVEDGGDKVHKLRAGKALSLGNGSEQRGLEELEEESLWVDVERFELLSAQDEALVEIGSVPSGALVEIDGCFLGATPLLAAVRPGHRRLTLKVGKDEMVRELIDVGSGAYLSRMFDLHDLDAGAADEEAKLKLSENRGSPEARLSAPDLLRRAQKQRRATNWRAAAASLKRLVREHPRSAEAMTGRVSLGVIELEKLRSPASALRRFNSYLSSRGRGPLAQEALYHKARALRTMGRFKDEKQTLEQFVDRFPKAIQITQIQNRLEQLD